MKTKLRITVAALLFIPAMIIAQAPALGTAANFVLFTSVGAVSNTGISHITGNVGTNSGSSTAFGNVDGVMHDNDGASALCAADVLIAYNQLNATVPTNFPGVLLGNGQILFAGNHSIPAAATLNLDLILDAQGVPGAVFNFKIQGPFSTNANSKIKLINGAQACNVFWQVEGLVDMAAGTTMRGTIIANNAAINMNAGDTLEGRALSTNGAITISNMLAYTPIGCGSPVLTGPIAPVLGSVACYTIFSANGPVTNVGVTNVVGDVGTNLGGTTGFNPLLVVGMIHPVPDGSTAVCAVDLGIVYNYLNLLPYDIELLYPAQFGNNLVLTPHTYLMNAAVTFTDTLYLDAQGNPNAVFVFLINGAMNTSVYSKVVLLNGAQSQNVFWKVEGVVGIGDYSIFNGSIICNNGAINLSTGMSMNGRALTTVGAVNTAAINAIAAPGCATLAPPLIVGPPVNQNVCLGDSASFVVVATGVGLTYQWRRGNVNLVNGGNISGATNDTLTINPVGLSDAGNNYNVIVYGTFAPNDTSVNVSLIIGVAPVITTQPVNQTACLGDSISFTVAAPGTGLTYQWRRGLINLINSGNISGVNNDTLTINPVTALDFALDYNVIVTGTCGSDTSINVSLTIGGAPVITTQPVNQSACLGDSISFTVAAPGTGLTYQWRKGLINLINSVNISGVNNDTLTINPVTALDFALDYNVIVTGTCGSDTSINVSLTIGGAPVITTQPVNQSACLGDSISFTVAATGTGLTYQWRKGLINLINSANISGVNNDTLTINPVTALDFALDYNVIVTGTCGSDTSINVSLMLNTVPVIILDPVNQTVCAGDSVSFIVVATGTGLTYQWREGTVNLVNSGTISGVNNDTLTFNPVSVLDAANNYNVIVIGVCAGNDTSINFSLAVNAPPVITAQPASQSACLGDSISFTVAATGTGLTYQWRKGLVNLVNAGNISGVTTATLTINPAGALDAANNYNVIVSGTCFPADTSINVSLTLNTPPVIITEPVDETVCEGTSASFTVAATGTALTYQWRKGSVNLINSGNISGANSATLIINPANISDAALNYNVIVRGACSPNDTSVNVSLTVNPTPVAVAGSNSPVCTDSSIVLTSSTFNGGPYNWTGPNGFTSSTQNPEIPSASVADAGNYVLTVTVNGCTSLPVAVFVSVDTCAVIDFHIPDGFSPNGDGTNDLFVIRGILNFPGNTFLVYNRWGNKVFEANPYTNTWDGKSDGGLAVGGNELPVGTYFYVLDLGDGTPVYKGTIYLNR